MSKSRINQITEALKLIFMGLLVFFLWVNGKNQQKVVERMEYWENTKFKPDTINLTIPYTSIVNPQYEFKIPPATVIQYAPTPLPKVSVTLNDSLLIVNDSLQKVITQINTTYLKQFPTRPKLLYGDFTGDSLRLDFLNINGLVTTEKYGVNYQRFKYQWDWSFRADPPKLKNQLKHESLLFTGLQYTSPLIGGEYRISRNHLEARGLGQLVIQRQPQVQLQLTIGYKFK